MAAPGIALAILLPVAAVVVHAAGRQRLDGQEARRRMGEDPRAA